jgi:hypothetical protein
MIVNVEDVFYNKPKFSSLLYFAASIVLFFVYAYRTGAGSEAGGVSLGLLWIMMVLVIGYPVRVFYVFRTRRAQAVLRYISHLEQLDEPEMLRLLHHKKLSSFSRPFVESVGYQRFSKNKQPVEQ